MPPVVSISSWFTNSGSTAPNSRVLIQLPATSNQRIIDWFTVHWTSPLKLCETLALAIPDKRLHWNSNSGYSGQKTALELLALCFDLFFSGLKCLCQLLFLTCCTRLTRNRNQREVFTRLFFFAISFQRCICWTYLFFSNMLKTLLLSRTVHFHLLSTKAEMETDTFSLSGKLFSVFLHSQGLYPSLPVHSLCLVNWNVYWGFEVWLSP